MDNKHFKAFNLEHARAGAPVKIASGYPVEILTWKANSVRPIVGLVNTGAVQTVCEWTDRGTGGPGSMVEQDPWRLVMAPLFMLGDFPVFVGDTIVGATGEHFTAEPRDKDGDIASWSWPRAASGTETRMSYADLLDAQFAGREVIPKHEGMRNIANAAIARAIADGDVVPAAMLEKVAMKVRSRCASECSSFDNGIALERNIAGIDLAAVIASVRGAA